MQNPYALIRKVASLVSTMDFKKVHRKNRKAISPVLATVILIAITLIAAIAIAGFVFGLFGSFTSTAQLSASNVSCTGPIAAIVCDLQVSNTGSSNVAITGATLKFADATAGSVTTSAVTLVATTAPIAACAAFPCTLLAGQSGTISITFDGTLGTPNTGTLPVAGSSLTGSLSLSNGGTAQYSGTIV